METKEFEKKYGKYLPGYVSLYWVDYRDDLRDHMGIVQKAISSGEYYPITEELDEMFDPVSAEMEYVKETERLMSADGISNEEIESVEDDLIEWIQENDESTPIKDLIRNTGKITVFYSLGRYLDSDEDTIYAELIKIGVDEKNARTIAENAFDGGDLRIYFSANIDELIEAKGKYIVFDGEFSVGVINYHVGSGWYEDVVLDNLKLEFKRENLIVSREEKWGLEEVFGMYENWCESDEVKFEDDETGGKEVEESGVSEYVEQTRKWAEDAKKGKCHIDDPDFRHHDMVYENDYPCGWRCKRCGKFVVD